MEHASAIVDRSTIVISRHDARAYARAVGLSDPAYEEGTSVSPAYLSSLSNPAQIRALDRLLPSGTPAGVHVQHLLEFHGQLRCPVTLDVTTSFESVEVSERNTRVTARVEFAAVDGDFRALQLATGINRGGDIGVLPWRAGSVARIEPRAAPPAATATIDLDGDQPLRYAAATGERSPFHISMKEARAAGFPGLIAHATNLMARYYEALRDHVGRGRTITGFGVVYGEPVTPPCTVTVSIAPVQSGPDGTGRIAFDADSDGHTVARAGFVRVGPVAGGDA